MRYSNQPTAGAGSIRVNVFGLRQTVILIAVGVALIWIAIAFAQEAYVSHRLGEQVSELRRQNAQIVAENSGYLKDVQALSSGTGDEEEARKGGMAKPFEHVYLVTTPSPAPSPAR